MTSTVCAFACAMAESSIQGHQAVGSWATAHLCLVECVALCGFTAASARCNMSLPDCCSVEGQVFSWGFGYFGEGGTRHWCSGQPHTSDHCSTIVRGCAGTGDAQLNVNGVVVEGLRTILAKQVACGYRHSIVVGSLEPKPKKGAHPPGSMRLQAPTLIKHGALQARKSCAKTC